jgi:circadian clock protein KaiC
VKKMPTGIDGFDEMTDGGLPRGRTVLVLGEPGAGKTVFGLQTLVNGIQRWGESGIFVAFEESCQHVMADAATFGWPVKTLGKNRLLLFDARLAPDVVKTGTFELTGLLAALSTAARRMQARRIVFDGIDVLLAHLADPAAEREELFRLNAWLSESGLTGILTAKQDERVGVMADRYPFLPFMADCVLSLHHRLMDGVSLRALRVIKYRGSAFAENECPFLIGPSGLTVASAHTGAIERRAPTHRVSSGIRRLDTMLGGGYYREATMLITGSPGTAKTTLAGAFIDAACRRGERALFVGFDEDSADTIRNLGSVGIRLDQHLRSGLLLMQAERSYVGNADAFLVTLTELIRVHKPRCLVIDPLSAMVRPGGAALSQRVVQQLLRLSKAQGVTVVATSLLEGANPQDERSIQNISPIADTWMHLTYVASGGERNRALTIIKSRGTKHSNQVRELILSDTGLTLAEVSTAGGAVLMGTARWEKETAEGDARTRLRLQIEQKRRGLELAEAEIDARSKALTCELEAHRADLAVLSREEQARLRGEVQHDRELHRRRHVEGKTASATMPRSRR